MIKRLGLLVGLLFAAPAAASDWYISPSSPFTSRTIEGTQCRYLRMDSTDSGYTPALDTHTISKAKFQHDWNAKVTGTGASVMLKSCSSPTDTNTCTNFQADLNGDNVFEDASLTTDIEFYAATPPQYLRAQIATPATVPAITTVVVCGWTGSVPLSEIDPLFQAMDTEAELEAHLHGLNVWTEADGPLGGGGGGSSPTDIAQGTRTSTTVPITSSTGADATLTAATTSLAGVMTATDKTKLDGIAAGATVGLGSDPSACPAGQVVNDQNQSGVLVCVNDDDVPESGDFGNAVGLTSTGAIKAGAVSIASISATGTPSGTTFLRGDGVWATPPGGGTGISALFDDPNPTLSNNLDINRFDITNLDLVAGAIYYAKNQSEAEDAIARIPSNYGGSNPTGATIQLACGPMTWDGFRFSAANSQSDSHSGIELHGCGPGGNVASNGTGAGGSTTLQATQALPMIAYGSCSSCKVSNVVIDGNDVATVGIDMDDTAGGFPNTQSVIEDVHIHHVNGPAIRTGYYTVAAASLTRSGTTATFDSSINHLSNTGDIVEITGASDPLYNGKFNITVVDADTFTYPVSASAAASATGAAFFSQTAAQIQVDTFTVRNAILASNDLCYRQLHSQSIGGVFDDVSCTNSNGTEPGGLEGLDIRAGELTYNNSYFGTTPGHDGNIFINRGWQSGRITVRNTQIELHGTTGFYVVKDDDQSAIYNNSPVGSTLWSNFIFDGSQVVYNEPGNCFSVKREGTYTVTNNRFDDQGGGGHACDSNFASDIDPYPQDRLELIEYGNLYTAGLPGTYPGSWHPTLASDVDLMLTSISSDSPPDDCVIGQIWVDTNATTGQRLHTCELVTGTPTWVAQAGGSGEAAVFQVSAYGTGYTGVSGAINACTTAGGGVVQLPEGTTTIDATAIASPIITLPAGSYGGRALCQLVGYGDVTPNQYVGGAQEAQVGGSTLLVTNSGSKTVVKIAGHDQVLRDFSLVMPNMTAGGVAIVTENRAHEAYAAGEQALGGLDWKHVSLVGPYPDASRAGNGLVLWSIENGQFLGGQIKGFTNGIVFEKHPSYVGANNSNSFRSMRIADNTVGLLFNQNGTGEQSALYGMTVEGNATGASFAANSDMTIADYGSWWENNPTNISIVSNASAYNGYSSRFGAASDKSDIVRSVANARKIPDTLNGSFLASGTNYTNGAVINVGNNNLVRTDTATSPAHVSHEYNEQWLNIAGIKYPTQPEDPDFNDTILKTKAIGQEDYFVNLSKSEAYGKWLTVIGGADNDLVGLNIDVYNTGGAQARGDEGTSGIRMFVKDNWLTAEGTIAENIPSGAGTSEINLTYGPITADESKMLGEGKLAVFGIGTNYTLNTAPPGTVDGNGSVVAGWEPLGGGTGQGQWVLGSSPGIASTGYCLSSADSAYNDINGTASRIWLPIINVSGSTITTQWLNQGRDAGNPYMYPATSGSAAINIRPCVVLGRPVFNAGDKIADAINVIRAAGFPGATSGDTFRVTAYPGIRQNNLTLLTAKNLGGMYPDAAIQATNLLDGSNMSGRMQITSVIDPGAATSDGLSPHANMVDGKHHGFKYGIKCDNWDCETLGYYRYTSEPVAEDLVQYPFELNMDTADWDEDKHRIVMRTDWGQAWNLTVDKTDGWAQNGDPFLNVSELNTISELSTLLSMTGTPSGTTYLRGDGVWATPSGGSASNSFETQNVTSGTDPVADSSTDTLNWTTGTGIIFTGNSTTDTIDVTLASALVDLADGTLSGSAVQQFGTSNAGAVPSSGGGTTNYLRADGTWAAPGGSGTVTTSGTPANTNIALFSGSTVITGESDLTYNTTTNALDVNGPLTANSIVADPTTTPSVDFDDSDDTGTIDAQILVDCPTAGDCYMAFLADAGGTSTEVLRIQTPDTGTQSLRMTAAAAPPTPAANTMSIYAKDGTPDLLCAKDSAGAETCMGTGSSSPFTLSGDTGSESIADGNTMSVLGGTNGIDTVVSATDTVTLNIDLTELSGTASSLTAGTATNAVNVGTAAAGAISAASIPLVTTTTGNQAVLTDPGITYNTTSNALSVGSVITADPGDGSRRSTFTTNTTSVDAPSAGECNLGFVGTVLYKHCNGESQAAIDTAGSGDNVNVNGSSTVDPNFTSTGSEITLVNTSNVITFTINDNVTVSGWSGDTAAVNDNDTSLATTAFVQAETVATGEVTGTLGGGFTIADTVTVTGWTMGASVATTPAVDDGDTSLATTLFVQNETVASGDVTGTLGTGFQIAGDVVAAAEINETTNYTWTGVHDFGGGTLEVPNSITLPATCTVGQIYMDTDATTGQRMYACQATNTWALQGDGGGGGSAAGSDTQVQFNDGGTAFGGDAGLTYNKTTDALTVAGTTTIGTVSDPADAGAIRLDNNTSIGWESAPTGTDVTITVDASELVQIAGGSLDFDDITGTSTRTLTFSDAAGGFVFNTTTAGNSGLLGTATLAGNPGLSANEVTIGTTGLIFEGAADAFEGLLTPAALATTDRTWTLPDASTFIPVIPQVLTISGPSTARTITVPDANFTVARTDAANTFTGVQTMDSPVITTKMNAPSATAFPGSPATGDVVVITDDSAIGACDSSAGSSRSLCRWNGSAWQSLGDGSNTGSSTPGGSTTQAQFNNAGSLSGNSQLTFASTTAGATFTAGSATAGTWPVHSSGTLLTTAEDGAHEVDADVHYLTSDAGNRGYVSARHCIRADSSRALTSATTEQALFNSPTNGRLTLEAGTYAFEGYLSIGQSGTVMSATSGNAALDPIGGGTAVTGNWLYQVVGIDATNPATAATQTGTWNYSQQTAASMVTAGTGTALAASFNGTFEVQTAGTVIPSVTLVTAAAATVQAGTNICFERQGSQTMTNIGQWD